LALIPGAQLRLFGKPEIAGRRRLGVALVRADNVELAIEQAKQVAAAVDVKF
jgi:phosphoribosylglycinamide formyltransferase 2